MFKLDIKNIDKKIISLMLNGFKFSNIILVVSLYILLLYTLNPISHIFFECGLSLFKLSLTCAVSSFICGFAIDKIINRNL